ncbi:immunoglobulin-like domain-containing protein [Paenibacillus humicola]|uniref:immunoglobulin-like domain-containing protein n=1 Tax=Paenibacillus humicola TaxID=3110540 RepID=UPI00237B3510|nr:immunoglobulin-like domain-containing protein [Paenibacillus humicola]
MWKRVAVLAFAAMMLAGGTAMAHGGGNGHGKSGEHHGHGKKKEMTACVPPGLKNALAHVKNEKARAAIKQALAKRMSACGEKGTKPSPRLTDTQRVTADAAALQIRYSGSDTASSVTGPVALPVRGKNGSAIAWSSNRPDLISASGAVHRPQGSDAAVVLTAKLHYNRATSSRTFTLTVKAAPAAMTDQQRVNADAAALQLWFNGSDTSASVTQPLKALPLKGKNGSTIYWYSSAPAVVSNDGRTVNRPAYGSGDQNVVLTAVVSYQTASQSKTFTITVKAQMSDAQRVAADKAALAIDFGGSDTSSRVTRPFDALPSAGPNGSAIVWTSSAPSVISNDGKTVNRPAAGAGDINVVVTAYLTNGTAADVKVFVLTVKQQFTAAEKLAADKADLAVRYASGDSAASVTKSVALPTTGYYGSTIVWYSSAPSIIADDGRLLSRPARGQQASVVTLLAYIKNGGLEDVKTFTLTVKPLP